MYPPVQIPESPRHNASPRVSSLREFPAWVEKAPQPELADDKKEVVPTLLMPKSLMVIFPRETEWEELNGLVIVELGPTGCTACAPTPLPPGSAMWLRLALPQGPTVRMLARVISLAIPSSSVATSYRIQAVIEGVSPGGRQAIGDFVARRREALKNKGLTL